MRATGILFLSAVVLVAAACRSDRTAGHSGGPSLASFALLAESPDESRKTGLADKELELATARPDQKLIRSAVLHIEVGDAEEAMSDVASIVAGLEGFVADSQLTRGTDGGVSSDIVVCVPWSSLDAAVSALKELGRVGYERLETRDVTMEYTDLETRLAVKREAAARLRQMLSSQTAKLEDLLAVERELNRVIEEIERHEARKRYFDRQVALSTITLQLTDQKTASGPAVLAPIGEAFGRAVEVLVFSVSTLVYVLTFLVPWLCLAAALWWLVRRFRPRRGRKNPD